MDRIEAMNLLLSTIETGSFSAAARALRIPVQTVSRNIGDLEKHLGTQLLTRTTRKLGLTDAGVIYAAAAKKILEQVAEAERTAAGEFVAPRGELVISAPLLFGRIHVLPVVADFLGLFPEINVKLDLRDRNVDLLDDQIDMAVRIGHLPDSGMIPTRVGAVRVVICASPRLLAEHGVPQTPLDLKHMPCIAIDGPTLTAGWRFQAPDTGASIEMAFAPRLLTGPTHWWTPPFAAWGSPGCFTIRPMKPSRPEPCTSSSKNTNCRLSPFISCMPLTVTCR